MVSQASTRGALFTVLSFPLLLPLLISAIGGTQATLVQGGAAGVWGPLQVLAAYAVAMGTVSLMLFPVIWTE
jgi:heme exporter protein B